MRLPPRGGELKPCLRAPRNRGGEGGRRRLCDVNELGCSWRAEGPMRGTLASERETSSNFPYLDRKSFGRVRGVNALHGAAWRSTERERGDRPRRSASGRSFTAFVRATATR